MEQAILCVLKEDLFVPAASLDKWYLHTHTWKRGEEKTNVW